MGSKNMNFIYGYCRISTKTQSIERQERNILSAYPAVKRIYKEAATGTKLQGRKELDRLLSSIQPGDTVIFDSVSRMSRNAEEGSALYEQLFQQGVNLIFLKEPHINTDVYKQAIERRIELASSTGNNATDRLLNSIMDALNRYSIDLAKEQVRLAFGQAQKEVDDLHQRTKEGIETARRHNKQIGQCPGGKLNVKKAAPAKECIRRNSKAFGGSLNDVDCIKLAGISRNTYYKYKAELKAEFE